MTIFLWKLLCFSQSHFPGQPECRLDDVDRKLLLKVPINYTFSETVINFLCNEPLIMYVCHNLKCC